MVCKHLERWRTERIGINAPLLGSKSRLRLRPIEISALLVGQNVSGDRGPIALALAWCPVLQSHPPKLLYGAAETAQQVQPCERADAYTRPQTGSFNLFTERSRRGHLHKLALTFWSHNRQNTPAMTSLCPTSLRAGRGVGYREFRSEFRCGTGPQSHTLYYSNHIMSFGANPRAVVYGGKCICSTMG